jgi:hypothetical protein
MVVGTHIFNQYYFELLKKIRDKARSRKYDSREARHILKGVKANYLSYDKNSDEYRLWFISQTQTPEAQTTPASDDPAAAAAPVGREYLYQGVKCSDIRAIFDGSVLDHFIAILELFSRDDLSADDINNSVKALRSLNKKDEFAKAVEDIGSVPIRDILNGIMLKYTENKGSEMDDALKRIENTSLGKLAKEIMGDINIDEIQKGVEDGDILKSLSNPEGPLTKVLSTVSTKMIAKLASGELQQEDLLKDAMKLAGDLGMAGGAGGAAGGMGGLGDIGAMIQQMQKMGLGGGLGGLGGGGGGKKPSARHIRRKMKEKKPPKE